MTNTSSIILTDADMGVVTHADGSVTDAETGALIFSGPTYCPHCDYEGELLGNLGRLTWYRCRGCGSQYSA